MGIVTTILCDGCNKELRDKEDFMSIEVKVEIDRHDLTVGDYRARDYKIFCPDCGKEKETKIRKILDTDE